MLNILFGFTCSNDIYTFLGSESIYDETCLIENEMKSKCQSIYPSFN
jgi:hypothetical protein